MEAARERLVADWLEAHERGEQAIMLAHRRRDVADLNGRARDALRALGRIGDDHLTTESRAFAVGDRVVARRNDRRLGVVNGDAGQIAAIADGWIAVTLEDGRTAELTEAYARAGHMDHGYASRPTWRRERPVDRAFVLGSEELYGEWGYTALSRHREEARFYVSATPTFLNRATAPVNAAADTAREVTRTLSASRAQRLALDGLAPDPMRGLLADDLEHARGKLAAIETQLSALERERHRIRWYERAARRDLERRMENWERPRKHWLSETERLTREVDARPVPIASQLSEAIDPLTGIEPRARDLGRHHSIGIER